MDHEQLLKELAAARVRAARQPEAHPPLERIEAYRKGGLEPAERERLEAHLAECGFCVDYLISPEPLSAQTATTQSAAPEASIARPAADAAGVSENHAPAPATHDGSSALPSMRASGRPPQHARLPAMRGRRIATWITSAIAGFALLLVLFPRGQVSPPAVPPYSAVVVGGMLEVRSATDTAATSGQIVGPESVLTLRLRPDELRQGAPPAAFAYLRANDGTYLPFEPAPEVTSSSSTGLIELRVAARPLLNDRFGQHEVKVLLLPAGVEPPARLEPGETPAPGGGRLIELAFEYRSIDD